MADDTPKEEKTEEGTARRFEEARKKGQVAYSSEFQTGVGLVAASFTMVAVGARLTNDTGGYLIRGIGNISTGALVDADAKWIAGLFRDAADSVVPALLLFLAPLMVVLAISGFAQAGFHMAGEAVAPDFNKINPIKGIGRLFSMRSVVRTGLAVLKILLLAGSMIGMVYLQRDRFGNMAGADLRAVVITSGGVIAKAALAGVTVIVLLAVIDLLFQRFQHKKDLRMTKQEIKEEHKSTDGDPQIKARIRQMQREMSSRRMMSDVPDATVVLTNPTHYAVALRYVDDGVGAAPIVVAKGVDDIAQAIKKVARESNVMVYEDPPLARALHRSAEIGDEIPAELFGAVAKVLAYVFQIEGRSAFAG